MEIEPTISRYRYELVPSRHDGVHISRYFYIYRTRNTHVSQYNFVLHINKD